MVLPQRWEIFCQRRVTMVVVVVTSLAVRRGPYLLLNGTLR